MLRQSWTCCKRFRRTNSRSVRLCTQLQCRHVMTYAIGTAGWSSSTRCGKGGCGRMPACTTRPSPRACSPTRRTGCPTSWTRCSSSASSPRAKHTSPPYGPDALPRGARSILPAPLPPARGKGFWTRRLSFSIALSPRAPWGRKRLHGPGRWLLPAPRPGACGMRSACSRACGTRASTLAPARPPPCSRPTRAGPPGARRWRFWSPPPDASTTWAPRPTRPSSGPAGPAGATAGRRRSGCLPP
mmetsp:Transcript_42281/g.126522  ORF Transcript_42281/g.126522 Transcript_42281/m.126522 type:complete len:243 (+) Transcript_42281:935-1663(+)